MLGGPVGSVLLIVLGTAIVVGSGYAVYLVLQSVPQSAPEETRGVVFMAQEVSPRSPIPREAVRMAEVPARLVPSSAVLALEEVDGKLANDRLIPGEMLLRHRLAASTPDQGLAVQLGNEEVAVTFPAAGVAGVTGVFPGDRVDVLATFSATPTEQSKVVPPPFTTVVLQNVRVIAVSRTGTARPGALGPLTGATGGVLAAEGLSNQIVVAASYQDALFLKSLKDAENVRLDLVLRPVGAREPVASDGVSLKDALRLRNITVPLEPR